MLRVNAEKGELATALAGLAGWLVLVLFRGFSPEWTALPLSVAAVATLSGGPFFLPGFLIMALAAISPVGAASAAAAGVLSVFASKHLRGRVFGWLALAVWVCSNPSRELLPLAAACAFACLFDSGRIRVFLALLSAVVLLSFVPLPGPPGHDPAPCRCYLEEGHAWWKIPSVTLGTPGAVLAPPVSRPFSVTLDLSCGGVRDTFPVVAVLAGDMIRMVPPGEHSITLELGPSDSVFILPLREPSPFTHPVAHVRAEAAW